jgi:hypothetical protein
MGLLITNHSRGGACLFHYCVSLGASSIVFAHVFTLAKWRPDGLCHLPGIVLLVTVDDLH